MRKEEKRLLSNTVFLYIMQICGYVFPFLTFPYLTRVLGPDKYGVVVFSNAVMSYFQQLVEFGFVISATNTCSIFHNDKERLSHITFGVIQAKMLLALAGTIILFLCCLVVPNFSDKQTFFWISYISIIFSIFLPDYLFRGIEKMNIITYRVLFSKFVNVCLIFLLVRSDSDYLKVPLAAIGGNLIAITLTWYEIIRKLNIKFVRVSLRETIRYLRESSSFFLSRVAVSMYQSLNTVVLGFRFSNIEIAQYGAANTLISSGRALICTVSDSVYPYMIKQKNYRLIKKIIFISEPIVFVVCIILFIYAKPIIVIICGKQYIEAVPIFRVMLPLVVVSLPVVLFGYPVLGALKKIHVANLSVIVASIFHTIGLLILLLTNRLNFISIVILTFCTECIVFITRLCCIVRSLSVNRKVS
jgi:PST family polysaccharide transporter